MQKKQFESCLLVSSPYSWGGGMKTMRDGIIQVLNELCESITIVTPNYSPGFLESFYAKKSVMNGIQVFEVPTLPFIDCNKYPYIHHIVFALRARKYRKQCQAAIAMVATAHGATPLAYSGMPYSIWVATGYADELESKICSSNGSKNALKLRYGRAWRKLAKIEQLVYEKATDILPLSDHTANIINSFKTSFAAKSSVVHMPIDYDLFSPDSSVGKTDGLLVYVGRLNDSRKDIMRLIRCFSIIKKGYPTAKLQLIGSGLNEKALNLIKELELNTSVEVIGELSREKIPGYLRKAELFVATPVQEGLGISILEAMSCGLPIIITPCGGPETIIAKSQGGLVTENSDDAFAEAVIATLSSKVKIAELSTNAREYICSNLSFEHITLQFKKSLSKTII